MSTVDQAFIKAFHGRPQTGTRGRRYVASGFGHAVDEPMRDEFGLETAASEAPDPAVTRAWSAAVDQSHAPVSGGPHFAPSVAYVGSTPVDAVGPEAPPAGSGPGPHVQFKVVPTPSAPVEVEQPPPSPAPPEKETTTATKINRQRPDAAFEVDRFAWPSVTDELNAANGAEIDRIVHRLLGDAKEGRNAFLVAGGRRGEGRTTFLLCLARRLAAVGVRAAVVDADFKNPTLASRLGVSPEIGWESAAEQDMGLEEAMIESVADGVTVLPATWRRDASLGLHHLPQVLSQLKAGFPLVLIDGGPQDDSLQLVSTGVAAGIDSALLICDERYDDSPDRLASVGRQLQLAGVEVLGVVANFCSGGQRPRSQSEA